MILAEFLAFVKTNAPRAIVEECLRRSFVHAIPEEDDYKGFLDVVRNDYPDAEHVAIMGSGNWKFSLNPKKNMSEFHAGSDIDVAIVCPRSFDRTWEALRAYHRKNFYAVSKENRLQLRRNGENVYAGFISPKWIPGQSDERFAYKLNKNKYSTKLVGYRDVNMMFFKNVEEVIDYYVRGFQILTIGK